MTYFMFILTVAVYSFFSLIKKVFISEVYKLCTELVCTSLSELVKLSNF